MQGYKNKSSNKITHRLNQGNTKQPFGLFGKSKSSVSGETIIKFFLRFHSRVGALPWKWSEHRVGARSDRIIKWWWLSKLVPHGYYRTSLAAFYILYMSWSRLGRKWNVLNLDLFVQNQDDFILYWYKNVQFHSHLHFNTRYHKLPLCYTFLS